MTGQIDHIYNIFLQSKGITTDSRKVEKDMIFFGLKGENYDGNAFAMNAITNGACLAVIDNPEFHSDNNRMILVENTVLALQELAGLHRKKFQIPVIAITGSNGKTTTKELLSTVLSKKYEVTSTIGNLNNHIGLPLTILKINDASEIAVLEMGANHKGEIAALCNIGRPTCGIITNIGKAHLGGFGGLDGVISAKRELYDFITANAGCLFVNADNPLLMKLSEHADRITYGSGPDSRFRIVEKSGDPFVVMEFEYQQDCYTVKSNLYGNYNFENIACAVGVGLQLKVPAVDIVNAIESYLPENMRSQIMETAENRIYLDAYNANPTSMRNAIEFFDGLQADNKMMILGDMLELGDESEAEHKAMLDYVKNTTIGKILLVGPEFNRVSDDPGLIAFPDYVSAGQWLRNNLVKECNILIKGSRGIQLDKIISIL